VVVDDIELLVDWNPIGPRFSNFVLSALKSLLKRKPPKERRRMVFATTSERSVLQQLQLLQFFDGQIPVPNVNTEHELLYILVEDGIFDEQTARDVIGEIQQNTGRQDVGVSIKRILTALNKAKEKREDVASSFVELMSQAVMEREA
jgi:vesicle-fusing ATPase